MLNVLMQGYFMSLVGLVGMPACIEIIKLNSATNI